MDTRRPLVLREVLSVEPDPSERLVTALEYLTSRRGCDPVEATRLYRAVEKGSSYRFVPSSDESPTQVPRGMFAAASIDSLSLAGQVDLLRGGFAEFEDGCWVAPAETRISRTTPRAVFLAFERWLSSLLDACERIPEPERSEFVCFLLVRLEQSYLVLEVSSSELLGTLLIR